MNFSLLPATPILFAASLGAILYYLFDYIKASKALDFKLTKWIAENALKILILSPLCLIAYIKFLDTSISEQSAFITGLGISSIINKIEFLASIRKDNGTDNKI